MATNESFVFSGTEWNDFTNFRLQDFDPGVASKRFRWISGADSDGALLADESHYDNAEMTVRIRITPQTSMDNALAKIGTLVQALQEAEKNSLGVAAVWTPAGSTKSLTAYVLGGEVTGLPIALTGDDAGWFLRNPAPVLTMKLTRRPFLYGAEVTSAATVTNTNPFQLLTLASVPGDVPAEARLVVTDAATQNRRHFEWGLQQRYYDAATSLLIDSDDMVTSGFAGTGTTRTGAYDPNASGNSVIRATLTNSPVAVCGVGNLSHIGTFRVKARVYANPTSDATADDFKVRVSWKEGDGPLRSNDYVSPVVTAGWSEIDLGLISIPPKTLGTQRWTGQVEAYSEDAGDTLDVDYLLLFPAAEGYGKGRAIARFDTPTAFSARDEFDQTAGALTGKTAPVGGTWTVVTSSDADDFSVETAGKTAERTAVSDAGETPRMVFPSTPTALTDTLVQTDLKVSAAGVTGSFGVFARGDGTLANYARAIVAPVNSTAAQIVVQKRVASTTTTISFITLGVLPAAAFYTLRFVVFASGGFFVWFYPQNTTPGAPILTGQDSALATGGALASGRVGLFDLKTGATALTRNYDNFVAAVPTDDAVVFSGRSAEIRSTEALRTDSTGTYYGPIQTYRGARFYIPAAGSAGRTLRIIGKTRRNDVDLLTDDQVADSTTLTLHYTPRYLVAPR